MNARTFVLLKLLISGKCYNLEYLSNEYSVSERLIRYIIDDCDFYLKSIELPSITFTDDGICLNLSQSQKEYLLNKINNIDVFQYSVSAKERQDYILLSMLCCLEPIKPNFFAQLLNVSKSSIDKDLIALKDKVSSYGLDINTIQGKGVYLSGDEIDVRTCFVELISRNFDFAKIIANQDNEIHNFIERNIYTFVFEIYLKKVLEIVDNIEDASKLKLSFLSYKDLCIYLIIMINRVSLNRTIDLYSDYIEQLSELKSNSVAVEICKNIKNEFKIGLSESEVAYVCLMLESSHYTSSDVYKIKEWAAIQTIANKLINEVSKSLDKNLSNDKELLNSLTLHLGLSYFKIHNRIPVINSELENIKKAYEDLFEKIKNVVDSNMNEQFKGINDNDIAYLTLHFQAAIERNKEHEEKYNIIVVCIHGYGTASLMKESIISSYKNITVKKIVTRNNISGEDLSDIDFIVSSVDLNESRCPVVKVNVILKKYDYAAIDETIENISRKKKKNRNNSIDEFLSIVTSGVDENEKNKLALEIESYLNSLGISNLNKTNYRLSTYLNENTIKVVESMSNWKEAVITACDMLIKDNSIDNEYQNSVIETVEQAGTYMVIDKGIALVHGEIDKHVNKTCMSLLIIKDGVNFNNRHFDPVYLILCLGAKDTYTHNKALNDFLGIITDFKLNRKAYNDKNYIIYKVKEISEE